MNGKMREAMREATRLTGAGRLAEATATIQRLLGGSMPSEAPPASKVDPFTIDGFAEAVTNPMRVLEGLNVGSPGKEPGSVKSSPRGGGQFLEGTFCNAAGSRPYRVYIPWSYLPERAVPLVVMLHGCTQSPDDFAAGTGMNDLADRNGLLVAYPGQTKAANMQKCWNWFNEGDQARDRGEPSLIAGITRQIMTMYAVDADRVYVAGLSAGGAQAAIMGTVYPDLYAAVGVHSGLACGAARDMPSAFGAMRSGAAGQAATSRTVPPTIVFHGDRDTTVNLRNADAVSNQSAGERCVSVHVERGQVQGGHAWTKTIREDVRGRALVEQWVIHGAGHAWSGGLASGSYTDPRGPDASTEMVRFFLEHPMRRG